MVAALGSIAVIVALITAGKVHAFIALTIGSAMVGLASGLHAPDAGVPPGRVTRVTR